MVKQESSTPGVYLVGPAKGPLRPWCGNCHKFLKSETAEHDCTPVDLRSARRKASASGTSKRRIRMTPKKLSELRKVVEMAAVTKSLERAMTKLRNAKAGKARANAANKFVAAFNKCVSNKTFEKASNSLYHKFCK